MNILFVSPSKSQMEISILNEVVYKIFKTDSQTLTFPILSALTPANHDIQVVDKTHEEIDYSKSYNLVALTAMTSNVMETYEIADKFRQKNMPVVIGGWHASALPHEAKNHADAVVIGEAEELWPRLIEDCQNKKLKPFYTQEHPVDPKKIPHPRMDIYPKGTNTFIQASRGCPVGCEFCAISTMKHRAVYRKRSVKDVIEEIKKIPGKTFSFKDNSLTIDTNFSKELFKEIKPLNKRFSAMGNINILGEDAEFLRLSSDAGCLNWSIGFESISQKTLDNLGKKTNKIKGYAKGIKKIHDYGMQITGFFIFGNDSDTIETFDKTHEFLRKNEIDYPLFHILTPYPGTPLFYKLEKEGRILTKDWSKYKEIGEVVFRPKNMTPEELNNYTGDIYKKWYNLNASVYRTLKSMRYGTSNGAFSIAHNFHVRKSIKTEYEKR